MESSEDKQWATKYLIGPLTAPAPSDETSPRSHFSSSVNRASSASRISAFTTPPASHSKTPSVAVYPSPPNSASPTSSNFPPTNPFSSNHRQAAFADYPPSGPSGRGQDEPIGNGKGRRRGSSLGERFPGDMSHRPLNQIRKEAKAANRAPHLNKRHLPGADSIDVLDRSNIGGAYHHEGPYDATLLARNTSSKISPVEAVRHTNREALRATPRENIRDALDKHRPLQGTAVIPSGMAGMDGRIMNYEEGADLMREPDAAGGAYKRWDYVKYLPEDYKGKGEPSFSIDKAVKDHDKSKGHRRIASEGNSFEMQPQRQRPFTNRLRSLSGSHPTLEVPSKVPANNLNYTEYEGDMRRSNTTGRRVSDSLRRRFGSLRRNKKTEEH